MSYFEDLTNGVGKTLETVPELYGDALKPAAQESGKTLALIPRVINAVLSPLEIWILNKEYNIEETKKLLAEKLKNVPADKIVPPEPYVAVPAIQAISYSMNSDELRNLYANLLSKSMYTDTKDFVHPSFVEIIKQLSPFDSIVFEAIMKRESVPMVDLTLENSFEEYRVLETNICDLNILPRSNVQLSIDNLIKQNLIQVPYDAAISDKSIYDSILNSSYYNQLKSKYRESNIDSFSHMKKMINKTNLGILFYKVCVADL